MSLRGAKKLLGFQSTLKQISLQLTRRSPLIWDAAFLSYALIPSIHCSILSLSDRNLGRTNDFKTSGPSSDKPKIVKK